MSNWDSYSRAEANHNLHAIDGEKEANCDVVMSVSIETSAKDKGVEMFFTELWDSKTNLLKVV